MSSQTLFQRLTFSDLLMSGQADGNTVRYVVEGTATSGAAGVAEGGAKPESVLGLSTVDERIKKIATLLPVSDEMIEDAPAIQSYINGRLSLFIRIEEERQLFRGAAGGNEVQGILTSRGVPVYAGGTAVGNYAVQLFAAMNGMRGSRVRRARLGRHPPDRLSEAAAPDRHRRTVLRRRPVPGPVRQRAEHPVDLADRGRAGLAVEQAGRRHPRDRRRRHRAGRDVRQRAGVAQGGVSVEATNSHCTYFANNLVAIRAEERLGLAVYRPDGVRAGQPSVI